MNYVSKYIDCATKLDINFRYKTYKSNERTQKELSISCHHAKVLIGTYNWNLDVTNYINPACHAVHVNHLIQP